MKKFPLLLLTLVSLLVMSCESEESTSAIVDDFKLLTVTSEGKIFKIGNNTGNTENIGQIANQSNLIMLSTICNVGSTIYALEASYVPAPNRLIIYNKTNNTTTTQQIILPASLSSTMLDPFITNIEYNGTELIAIVSENMPDNSHPNKIITINLQNYQTTDLNIAFYQRSLASTELINDKLYVSTRTEGLLKIDLTLNTVTELQANATRINATRLVKVSNSKLGLMKFGYPEFVNGVKPFEFDLTNNSLIDKSQGAVFAVGNTSGGTVFYNDEYLNLVFNTNSSLGILKMNYNSNVTNFVPLNQSVLGSNTTIIGITN